MGFNWLVSLFGGPAECNERHPRNESSCPFPSKTNFAFAHTRPQSNDRRKCHYFRVGLHSMSLFSMSSIRITFRSAHRLPVTKWGLLESLLLEA
ncbi:MAG: hypothetical protein HW374_1700 [Bacteroidetes bacterium]|nr:hypothetical protein [Bacteroidota bacterium]